MQTDLSKIEQFCREEYTEVYRYACALLGNKDDALEVVQESFLRFYQISLAGEVRRHERALLFRLARNLALDRMRRQGVREAYAQGAQETSRSNVIAFAPPRTPEELLLEKELQQCASQALARLSEKEQECLELRSNGLSYREVAEALSLSPNTIGSLMARALRRFRHTYEEILEKKEPSRKTGFARRR
jgi:RNA polymerase sigma-70 factor (ECF subfamily)